MLGKKTTLTTWGAAWPLCPST